MPQQLSFDLPVRTALGRNDFFVAPSNQVALTTVEDNATWPSGKLILSGPKGSGKTHLAHVWASQSGARIVCAGAVSEADIERLAAGPLVIEDVPEIAVDADAQHLLFHLHNLCLAQGQPLLLTGQGSPRHWGLSLADLQSRMDGTHSVSLHPPDDQLLELVLAKLFADRQITPKPNVIPYLAKRIDRSFDAAQQIVEQLDSAALHQGRGLTRDFVRDLLGGEDKPA